MSQMRRPEQSSSTYAITLAVVGIISAILMSVVVHNIGLGISSGVIIAVILGLIFWGVTQARQE